MRQVHIPRRAGCLAEAEHSWRVLPVGRRWRTAAVVVAAGFLGLGGSGQARASQPLSTCEAYEQVSQVGTVTDPALNEASGLVASHLNPGLWWTIADSGNPAYLYGIHEDGTVADLFFVSGAANVDWEDLALAPCQESCACLYIADIGDSELSREESVIYRVSEPVLGETSRVTAASTPLRFVYEDGPHDSETLLVDPRTGGIYIITKELGGLAYVYQFTPSEQLPGEGTSGEDDAPVYTALRVGELSLGQVEGQWQHTSGGAFAPDGSRFAFRTEQLFYEFGLRTDQSVPEALAQLPLILTLPYTVQGEGMGYSETAEALYINSEQVPSPIYALTCTRGAPASLLVPALDLACADATTSGPVYGCGCTSLTQDGDARSIAHPLHVWGALLVMALLRRRKSLPTLHSK